MEHVAELFQKLRSLGKTHDIRMNRLVIPAHMFQFINIIGIRKKTYIKDQIRVHGYPVFKSETHDTDDQIFKLAALQEEMFRSEAFTSEDFGGVTVRMPSVLFNAVYILIHFLHHYWSGGVGLRQLTDWGLYVNRHFDEIDAGRLEGVLRDLGVLRLWQTFSGLSTTVLGIDKDRFPLWTDRYHRKYEGILRYMLKCGNFGMNQPLEAVERPYLLRKIHSFWRLVVADRLRHFPEFPAESVRYFTGAFHYGLIRLAEGE